MIELGGKLINPSQVQAAWPHRDNKEWTVLLMAGPCYLEVAEPYATVKKALRRAVLR